MILQSKQGKNFFSGGRRAYKKKNLSEMMYPFCTLIHFSGGRRMFGGGGIKRALVCRKSWYKSSVTFCPLEGEPRRQFIMFSPVEGHPEGQVCHTLPTYPGNGLLRIHQRISVFLCLLIFQQMHSFTFNDSYMMAHPGESYSVGIQISSRSTGSDQPLILPARKTQRPELFSMQTNNWHGCSTRRHWGFPFS